MNNLGFIMLYQKFALNENSWGGKKFGSILALKILDEVQINAKYDKYEE